MSNTHDVKARDPERQKMQEQLDAFLRAGGYQAVRALGGQR